MIVCVAVEERQQRRAARPQSRRVRELDVRNRRHLVRARVAAATVTHVSVATGRIRWTAAST